MLEAALRQAATGVLETAIRIAPRDVREWGDAMLGEIHQIDGGWGAIAWALGGAGVMAKHALLSLLIPGRRGHGALPNGGLFSKNVSVRNAAFAAIGVFVLGALLFFAAPPFRQGLQVSLASWNSLFHITAQQGQPRLDALAKRAEARRDAEGMVFAAARLRDAGESARMSEDAVRMDPNLIWAYAIVAMHHPGIPQVPQWIPKLVQWRPQNALFPMIAAESVYMEHLTNAARPSEAERHRAEGTWRKDMAAAFAAPKFDDYMDRLQALDQKVARRYGFDDPQELILGEQAGASTFALSGARRYAEFLIQSGETLEKRHDLAQAAEYYWTVARFGQVLDSGVHSYYQRWAAAGLQTMAYERLQELSAREGHTREAALFAYLGKKFDPAAIGRESAREGVFGWYTSRRNAAVLQISSLLLLVFSGLLIIAASVLIVRFCRRDGARRPRPWMIALAFTSAVGLLLSAATLYLTYRPYWYMFQDAILKGESNQAGQVADLHRFLMATRALPGLTLHSGEMLFLPVYFWTAVILAGVAGIAFIFLRHSRDPTRLSPAQPDPHMQ